MPKKLAKLYHFDSFGKRQEKYDKLNNSEFSQVEWQELNPTEPYYFFVPKDFEAMEKYKQGFSVTEIFKINISGIETAKDSLILKENNIEINKFFQDFKELELKNLVEKYKFNKTKIIQVKNDIENAKIIDYSYKPFDLKKTLYSNNSGGVLWRPRGKGNNLFLGGKNYGLILMRNLVNNPKLESVFVSKYVIDKNFYGFQSFNFPLYLYQENKLEQREEKIPNFDMGVIEKIEKKLGLNFVASFSGEGERIQERGFVDFSPEDLFDYIYAVLHSKSYREKFKEFLKIDFPKIPFDVDKDTFFEMRDLGKELRSWHLMENEKLIPKNFITKYPVSGDNLVEKIKYKDEKVFINDTQYFEGVPENVWNFYIGGYQPAQKWLKDRKTRKLNYDDILHYSKIIISLNETMKIMEKIEGIFRI